MLKIKAKVRMLTVTDGDLSSKKERKELVWLGAEVEGIYEKDGFFSMYVSMNFAIEFNELHHHVQRTLWKVIDFPQHPYPKCAGAFFIFSSYYAIPSKHFP